MFTRLITAIVFCLVSATAAMACTWFELSSPDNKEVVRIEISTANISQCEDLEIYQAEGWYPITSADQSGYYCAINVCETIEAHIQSK